MSNKSSNQQWRERWYGSGQDRGWSIMEGRNVVAYLGTAVDGETVRQIVHAHNTSLGTNVQYVGFSPEIFNNWSLRDKQDGSFLSIDAPGLAEGMVVQFEPDPATRPQTISYEVVASNHRMNTVVAALPNGLKVHLHLGAPSPSYAAFLWETRLVPMKPFAVPARAQLQDAEWRAAA